MSERGSAGRGVRANEIHEAEYAAALARVHESIQELLESWPMPVRAESLAYERAAPIVYCSDSNVHQAGAEPRVGVLPVLGGWFRRHPSRIGQVTPMDSFGGLPNEWWVRVPKGGREQLAPVEIIDAELESLYVAEELREPGCIRRYSRMWGRPFVPALEQGFDAPGPGEWGEFLRFRQPIPEGARPKIVYACPECCHKVGAAPERMARIAIAVCDTGMEAVSLKQIDVMLQRMGQKGGDRR